MLQIWVGKFILKNGGYFLALMLQLAWVIQCQSHPCKRRVIELSSPSLERKGGSCFPKDISPTMNVIARLEFELANYNVLV